MRYLAYLCLMLSACAAADDDLDDSEAETATAQDVTGTLVGLYATSTSTTLADGDIANLQLDANGSYIRLRCYHAGCALRVPESDHYDSYTSSSGKTYVRFYSFVTVWNTAGDDRMQKPVVADVYEVQKTSTTIRLRKSYSSRWVTLRKTTPKAQCTGDGGTWSTTTQCSCPGPTGWSTSGYFVFTPGAGGCVKVPGTTEDGCDTSGGYYADDDATPVGTFCSCDRGQYLTNDGCTDL
jgi:hypothetical protein